MAKSFICFICFAFYIPQKGIGQLNNDSVLRYKQAAQYFSTNRKTVQEKWISMFDDNKKRKAYYEKSRKEFNLIITNSICFQQIFHFKKQISDSNIFVNHTYEELNNLQTYENKFYYEPYISDALSEITNSDSLSKIDTEYFSIKFSKPLNNYLIAEVSDSPLSLKYCHVPFRGEVLHVLFLFDKKNILEKVLFSHTTVQ